MKKEHWRSPDESAVHMEIWVTELGVMLLLSFFFSLDETIRYEISAMK